jgi:hypothetical protein
VPPEEDLGIRYFSSSTDKIFRLDQKENPSNYKYIILKRFKSRIAALNLEIKLHNEFNVNVNPKFYNKAKQSSEKCDTSGTIFINGKQIKSEEYKKQNKIKYHSYGKVSVKNKNGDTFQVSVNDDRYKVGDLIHVNKNLVNAINKKGKKARISKKEYYSGNYTCNNTGKIPVKNSKGEKFLIDKNSTQWLTGEVSHVSDGMVSCKNIETGEFLSVSSAEFSENSKLVGLNHGNKDGENNPKSKIIIIYDEKGNIVKECFGTFKKICFENNYPYTALRKSYERNGEKIYVGKFQIAHMPKNNEKYKGWSAKRK